MGSWSVDGRSKRGLLRLSLSGMMSVDEMQQFVRAHDAAVDEMLGADYRVYIDIRKLAPLRAECASLFGLAKAYSKRMPNYRGSAAWVSTALIAMQHQRTSDASGVSETELISEDEEELLAHLERIDRTARR